MFEEHWWGKQTYKRSYSIQKSVLKDIQGGLPGRVMGFEHPSTITLGIRSQVDEDFIESSDSLEEHGFVIVRTDRGGRATIHSPGQLVIYPILSLRELNIGVKDYVSLLVETTSLCLSHYGVKTKEGNNIGVFTPRGKIAFIGLGVSKGVSFHGLSINVFNDLSLFSLIRPCGDSRLDVDSLALSSSHQNLNLRAVFQVVVSVFS